jgi:preprotein translocase subunit SecA
MIPENQYTTPDVLMAAGPAGDTFYARSADNPYYVPQLKKHRSSGRNDPCPCGSGKKFKNCHWRDRTR